MIAEFMVIGNVYAKFIGNLEANDKHFAKENLSEII